MEIIFKFQYLLHCKSYIHICCEPNTIMYKTMIRRHYNLVCLSFGRAIIVVAVKLHVFSIVWTWPEELHLCTYLHHTLDTHNNFLSCIEIMHQCSVWYQAKMLISKATCYCGCSNNQNWWLVHDNKYLLFVHCSPNFT